MSYDDRELENDDERELENDDVRELQNHEIDVAKLVAGYLDEERLCQSLEQLLKKSRHRANGLENYVLLKPLKSILSEYKSAKLLIQYCDPLLKKRLPTSDNLEDILKFLINYVLESISRPESPLIIEECPICLEELKEESMYNNIKILPCMHSYHVICIETWLNIRSSCPYCRQIVR